MSAPTGWVQCPQAVHQRPSLERQFLAPCPDCSAGWVPSQGEVEAACRAWSRGHIGGIVHIVPPTDPMRRALVAADRWRREATGK